MASYRAILPVTSELTASNLVDNFDERTIINDDLNMANYKIYNLKNPTDDQDAVTKYYVDIKQYNINSANITGNLPWSRLSNIPAYFPTKTSMITSNSNMHICNYKFMKNGNELIGLTNNSVLTNYINDNAVTDPKIQMINFNKLFNLPTSFASKTSIITSDSNLDIGNYKFMKNGNGVIGLTNNSVTTNYITDNAVTDSKILTLNYNKLTNSPEYFPSKSSTMTGDSDINMNTNRIRVPTPTDNTQVANKQYVDTTVQTTISNFIGTLIGCIMIWPTLNIPTNWLKCKGKAVSQTLFPQLYSIMNTVPDLRGVFIRGFANSSGIDSNRTLSSQQDDSFASYTHTMSQGGNHNHANGIICTSSFGTWGIQGPFDRTISFSGGTNVNNTQGLTGTDGLHAHTINTTGGTEIRPKNVALIYIIKQSRSNRYSNFFILKRIMQNLRNKSQCVLNKRKDKKYFERFTKLNVYTYTKPNDKKINLGCKPTEVYSLFNGTTSSSKKILGKEEDTPILSKGVTIDQSALQYYIILALQDFYHIPLSEENQALKDRITMMRTIMINNKKKNDECFEVLSKNIEGLGKVINIKK